MRREGLYPTSDIILSARAYLLQSLGHKLGSVAQEAINPVATVLAANVACVEAWTCLVVAMQVILGKVPMLRHEDAALHYKRTMAAVRARVISFQAGDVEQLWRDHTSRIALPTTQTWEKQRRRSAREQRASIGREAKEAIDQCDIKAGNMAIAAGVTAPPGMRELHLLKGLLPHVQGVPRAEMEAEFKRLGFDKPAVRSAALHARLGQAAERKALHAKWSSILANSKTRKQPCGTGWRTEFTKQLYKTNIEAWAVIFEAIEMRAVPDAVRRMISCPYVMQLLKRDAHRRYSELSKTRPIGVTCSLMQDALRPWVHRCAGVLACIVIQYGQMAVNVSAGGEAAQTAAQARCDMSQWVVTVAIDYKNAFGLLENELTLHALWACIQLVQCDVRVQALLAAKKIEVKDAVECLMFMAEDLVYTRTHDYANYTVVEGALHRIFPTIGETQGGLFSALRYVVAIALAVNKPLAEEYPEMTMRCIIDDGIVQLEVRSLAHVERLVAWMWRLDALVKGQRQLANDVQTDKIPGVAGKLNFDKFKILQHPSAVGTAIDLEMARKRLPYGVVTNEDGTTERKYPSVVRDILEFNGVAIGFCEEARREHVLREVDILEERTARLLDVLPLIGAQRAEIYGRASYRPSSVLVHQMRGSPPSVAMSGMDRATQLQLELFRRITGATREFVGGAMEEWGERASPAACSYRCSLSVHLPSVMGGCNWPEPRIIQAFVHAAKCVDTYPTIASMSDMADYPSPAQWSSSTIPALREAAAAIERLVHMRAFHVKPPGDAKAWERVHRLLAGPGNTVLWANVPKLAGLKFQRVATRAYALELLLRALQNPGVHQLAKIRLLAAAQPGAGEWCCLMGLPNAHVRLSDHELHRTSFARIGHPDPLITSMTRCCCAVYTADTLPTIPGRNTGLKTHPTVSEYEHRLGVHWHHCLNNGMSTGGHNGVSHAWLRTLRRLGYAGSVYEVPLGINDKQRRVYGDGVAQNFAVGATMLVWDVRISSSYLTACRDNAAREMWIVTDSNEVQKQKEKGEACARCLQGRAAFLPVVCNTHGGLGRRGWMWLEAAFQRKIDEAAGAAEKHSIRLEMSTSLAEISCEVHRRNSRILGANASPQAGGQPPAAPELFSEIRRDALIQDSI